MLSEKEIKDKLEYAKKHSLDLFITKGQTVDETEERKIWSIHVSGKKPWPAFNKAKQIHDLHESYNLSYDQLAKRLGMGKVTVIRMCNAYEQTDRYGGTLHPDDKEWYRKYSYFDELFRKRDLKVFVKLQKNLDDFANWIYQGKFKEHSEIRSLAKILADEDAKRIFEADGATGAIRLLEEKNPSLRSPEFKQIAKTIELIRTFPRKELMLTIKDSKRRELLEKLRHEIDSLLGDLDSLEKER